MSEYRWTPPTTLEWAEYESLIRRGETERVNEMYARFIRNMTAPPPSWGKGAFRRKPCMHNPQTVGSASLRA